MASSVHEPVQRRWDISGARLGRPASSVSDGVVVVVEVGSRCRVGELDGVNEVSWKQIVGEVVLRENSIRRTLESCNAACSLVEHVLAWHCILLASLQVHLHGDGACLGLHVGLGFSAPRVAFNMTRQPDVNITGAVVATACHGVLAATSVAAPCRPRGATPASSLGASVSSRCHRRRRQLDPVIGRQPGSESYRGVVACSRARSRTEVSSSPAISVYSRRRRR